MVTRELPGFVDAAGTMGRERDLCLWEKRPSAIDQCARVVCPKVDRTHRSASLDRNATAEAEHFELPWGGYLPRVSRAADGPPTLSLRI